MKKQKKKWRNVRLTGYATLDDVAGENMGTSQSKEVSYAERHLIS